MIDLGVGLGRDDRLGAVGHAKTCGLDHIEIVGAVAQRQAGGRRHRHHGHRLGASLHLEGGEDGGEVFVNRAGVGMARAAFEAALAVAGGAEAVLITRGSRGMALFEHGTPTTHIPIYGSDEIADAPGEPHGLGLLMAEAMFALEGARCPVACPSPGSGYDTEWLPVGNPATADIAAVVIKMLSLGEKKP